MQYDTHPMPRFATIDIGTNSVLLLVAERGDDGKFRPILERAEITRLGRGVDLHKKLDPAAMEDTLKVLEAFAADARAVGAQEIAATATSAARDASNGLAFLQAAAARAGLKVEIISGEEEARLSFAAALADFGHQGPMVVLDIGGGSTEFIYGDSAGKIAFRHSFDVGSVRMTERFVRTDPPTRAERAALVEHLAATFHALPQRLPNSRLIGVAGTVTTLLAVARGIEPYDGARVNGAELSRAEVDALTDRLCDLTLAQKRALPGLQPKRADVIAAGALVLQAAMAQLGLQAVTVSDRGLRWGLLADRFGAQR